MNAKAFFGIYLQIRSDKVSKHFTTEAHALSSVRELLLVLSRTAMSPF